MSAAVLGEYRLGKIIGAGAFSKVKLATHITSGLKVAIKIIDKKLMEEKRKHSKRVHEERDRKKNAENKKTQESGKKTASPSDPNVVSDVGKTPSDAVVKPEVQNVKSNSLIGKLELEVQLMMRLDHPNIIKIYQVIDSEDETYIVMEYAAGGEMVQHLAKDARLPEAECRKFFRQLISAIDHFHQANVVHRDLKLENILLTSDKNILVSDFGLGRTFKNTTDVFSTFCGTPNYAAVELICGIPYVGTKTDIWVLNWLIKAMGIILYVLAAGHPPFKGNTISQVYQNIKLLKYKVPRHFSVELVDLIEKILVKDPTKRIDMQEMRNHPWVNAGYPDLPLRVKPKFSGYIDESVLSKSISSIYRENEYTVVTIRRLGNIASNESEYSRRKASSNVDKRKSATSDEFSNDTLPKLPEKTRTKSITPDMMKPSAVLIQGHRRRMKSLDQLRLPTDSTQNMEALSTIPASPIDPQEAKEPTTEEINDWHKIHRPAIAIRPMQVTFRKGATSQYLAPEKMFQDLHVALNTVKATLPFALEFDRKTDYYKFDCEYHDEAGPVKFDLEICKLWLLSQHGLKSERLMGNALLYQQIVSSIIEVLHWK